MRFTIVEQENLGFTLEIEKRGSRKTEQLVPAKVVPSDAPHV